MPDAEVKHRYESTPVAAATTAGTEVVLPPSTGIAGVTEAVLTLLSVLVLPSKSSLAKVKESKAIKRESSRYFRS